MGEGWDPNSSTDAPSGNPVAAPTCPPVLGQLPGFLRPAAEGLWPAGRPLLVGGVASEAPPSGANDGELTLGVGVPAAMWASWSTRWGANRFDVPGSNPPLPIEPALFTDCVVHVNLTDWPDWRRDDARFEAFCKEVVHEYGHFEGHSDVGAASGTVEYEQPVRARLAVRTLPLGVRAPGVQADGASFQATKPNARAFILAALLLN